ncbi:MAG: type II and III secretion system protein family protein [Planctomyces sp.]
MPSFRESVFYAVAAILLAASSASSIDAETIAPPSTYRIRPGENEVSLFERYSITLEHSANIRTVLDFDADVIKIEPVAGNPRNLRVFALTTGVTTVTIVDEHGDQYSLEVLVRGDVRHLESYIRRLYPNDIIQIEEIKGAVRLDGWVTKPEHVSEIQMIAEQFYPDVMNHMKIGGVQQVLMKVTVMEVQRSKFRRLGMNFALIRPNDFVISTPGPITPITGLTSGFGGTNATLSGFGDSTITYGFTRPDAVFNGFIQAARDEGLLKLHATPMLVTHNGRPAHLLNGGETPVLTPAGLGTTAIEFKEFGIQLDAVPYILGNGRVRLELEAAIRDRDFANAVVVGGVSVPAFIVRKANTQVEMNFGEAIVIAGLVSQRQDAGSSKIPFLGELPWIGTAFNRKQYTEAETELMIIVTPEYVAPMASGQVPTEGPGTSTDIPTDRELFLHHLLEVPKFGDECESCQENCPDGHCPPPTPESSGPPMSETIIQDSVSGTPTARKNSRPVSLKSKAEKTPTASASYRKSESSSKDSDDTPSPAKKKLTSSGKGSGLISPTFR